MAKQVKAAAAQKSSKSSKNVRVRKGAKVSAAAPKSASRKRSSNPEPKAEEKKKPGPAKGSTWEQRRVRYDLIFGKYTVISVIRALGKAKWNCDQIRTVLNKVGAKTVADHTLRLSRRQGETGSLGIPADLTKDEMSKLAGMIKARKSAK